MSGDGDATCPTKDCTRQAGHWGECTPRRSDLDPARREEMAEALLTAAYGPPRPEAGDGGYNGAALVMVQPIIDAALETAARWLADARAEARAEGAAEAANAYVQWAMKNEIAEPPLDWAWFGEISRRYSPLHEQRRAALADPTEAKT